MVDKMIMWFSKINTFRVKNFVREYGVCILVAVSDIFFPEYEMIVTMGRSKVNKYEREGGRIIIFTNYKKC